MSAKKILIWFLLSQYLTEGCRHHLVRQQKWKILVHVFCHLATQTAQYNTPDRSIVYSCLIMGKQKTNEILAIYCMSRYFTQSGQSSKHTRIEIQDPSAVSVSVWQYSYGTSIINGFHRAGCYVSNYVHVTCSDCVVVNQQVVGTVVIKFPSTQKPQQKCIVSAWLQTCKLATSILSMNV